MCRIHRGEDFLASLFDYLDWRGELSFSEAPLNQVDNIILSELSYINFADIVPESFNERISLREAAEKYAELWPRRKNILGILPAGELQDMLEKAGATRRFGTVELWGFVNEVSKEQETQFSAVCYSLGNGTCYVAYRGTDNSIAGWKENFNMAFMFPVPAQQKAAEYLINAAAETSDRLQVGGHSKGGNLAVYASVFVPPEVQKRIDHIWSNDGPGFMSQVLESVEYRAVRDRITMIMPAASMVGVLLDSDCDTIVIESSAHGPKQHEGLSWQVMGSHFIRTEDTTSASKQVDELADSLVNVMTLQQRKDFIETVFEAVYKTGAETLPELVSDTLKPQVLGAVLSSMDDMDPETREQFMRGMLESFHVDDRIINFLFSRNKKEPAQV